MAYRVEDIAVISSGGEDTAVAFFADRHALQVTSRGRAGYKSAGELSEVALWSPQRQVVARFTPATGYTVTPGYTLADFMERWQVACQKAEQLARQGIPSGDGHRHYPDGPWSVLQESARYLPIAHVRT